MRATIQRVCSASVRVEGRVHSRIGPGLLVYLGVADDDGLSDLQYIADKIAGLRIFPDADGKMNLDASRAGVQILVVSAFSLQADARKGRRPSFDTAARPEVALQWYDRLCESLSDGGFDVKQGKFRAMMQVESVNDGPICILLDSKRVF